MHNSEVQELRTMMRYAAELELEVDRLRRQEQFLTQKVREFATNLGRFTDVDNVELSGTDWTNCKAILRRFLELFQVLEMPPGYHPAFDQVTAIAVRPLAEQVFRWHKLVHNASNAVLRLELATEYIDWFPARFRHILDNLFSNAVRYRDDSKGEMRVGLELQAKHNGFELRFTDNGLGMPAHKIDGTFEIFYRAAPARSAGIGVGLAVVKFLVEQCCGTVSIESGEGCGTSVTIFLPTYALHDHIESDFSRVSSKQ
jgi:signal transduction histidine kinase